ncbi:MAG: hypothetical protein M3Q58_03690 [Bacteroidota bacterium]|nr:hypothetical protein [Bacteroidota bacterium]
MKLFLFSILIIVSSSCFGQNPLAVDFGSNARIQDLRYHENEMNKIRERQRELEKQKTTAMINQTKQSYNSFSNYPKTIRDGWHNVISTNNYDVCDERKVFVKNNEITHYYIDNWIERKVSFTGPINSGKGMVKLKFQDGTQSSLLEIFFMEYIINSKSETTKPLKSGSVSFWTNFKNGANTSIYIDGIYFGKISSCFKEGVPFCKQDGTLTINYKPGTYSYNAKSKNRSWSGVVTITESDCRTIKLTKK